MGKRGIVEVAPNAETRRRGGAEKALTIKPRAGLVAGFSFLLLLRVAVSPRLSVSASQRLCASAVTLPIT